MLTLAVGIAVPASTRADDLVWHDEWRRVGWPEGVAAGSLVVGNLMLGLFPPETRTSGGRGILFDDAAARFFAGDDPDWRRFAQGASNYLWYGLELYPLVIDAGLVTLLIRQNPDVALQLSVISFNSLALTGVITQTMHHLVARDRPIGRACVGGDDDPSACHAVNRFRSFWSGHTAFAFTGAGLVCAHHRQLQLYGSTATSIVACAGTLTLATLTGIFRMVNNKHFATDILAAAGIGLLDGYAIPTWLYYSGDAKDPTGTALRLAPLVEPDTIGLALSGIW